MAKEISAMNYPLHQVQGATFNNQYTRALRDEDGVVTPVNLSTATITGAVKQNYNDAENLVDFTVTMIDAANGIFRISLAAADTVDLPVGMLKHEVRATWAGGVVETFFRGNFNVLAGIQP